MMIWTFGWTALAFNDAKRDLTVVEIVYRNSKMAACLLDLFRTGWKRPHWKFCWCVMCDTSDAPFHFLHRIVVRRLFICVAGHLNNRLPLNIRCPQLLSTTSCGKKLLDWNRREFLPSKVFLLLLRLSVHLTRSASSNFLAGEDVLLFPRA